MFEKGEYIIYGRSGICRIEDITHLNIAGADKKRLYYVLAPLNIKGNRVYFPVDKKDANARKVITEQEAWELLDEIPDIQEIGVANEKLREESYKQALNSCDYRQWVAVIKTLYQRKRTRLAQGKKIGATDERYLKMTEDALYGELAFVMGKNRSEMEPFIVRYIREKRRPEAAGRGQRETKTLIGET
ncbi:MAG: CarD family transcriptional regulator [Lachnospiraceae bacterium]